MIFLTISILILTFLFKNSHHKTTSYAQTTNMGNQNYSSSPYSRGYNSQCASSTNCQIPDISSFSFQLFSDLTSSSTASETKNILISPFSIASALAIVLAGATPQSTAQIEILSALGISSHEQIPHLLQTILQSSSSTFDAVHFTSANGIWIRKDSILQSYIDTVQNDHHAIAAPLPDTFQPIDDYVSQKTNGLISNMVSGPIDPLTVALLVNAVHFKGQWKEMFDKDLTKEGVFHTSDGSTKNVMFMNANRKMYVATNVPELDHATILRLDYGSSSDGAIASSDSGGNDNDDTDFCALFLLPQDSSNINTMFEKLSQLSTITTTTNTEQLKDKDLATSDSNNPSSLKSILHTQMHLQPVQLSLPKFQISYGTQSLKQLLSNNMGIQDIFQGRNVLNAMSSGDPDVHLDDVLHKAVMEVSEEGTVAAAATIGIVMTRSIPRPPLEVRFDRPFGMIVLHKKTMTPLFMGRIGDPE